jgi:hypothetical protein
MEKEGGEIARERAANLAIKVMPDKPGLGPINIRNPNNESSRESEKKSHSALGK